MTRGQRRRAYECAIIAAECERIGPGATREDVDRLKMLVAGFRDAPAMAETVMALIETPRQ